MLCSCLYFVTLAPQKQIGGPAGHGDPSVHQSFGVQDAMAAAIVMAGALGGGQNGIRSQPIPGTDPLTLHLAKMSNTQLTEVLTEVKVCRNHVLFMVLSLFFVINLK